VSNAAERDDFDPYRVWLGIPKSEQPPNHYRLLGIVQFEDDPQVILEGADRQVSHLKTKQTGQRVALSQKLLQQVAAAAGCLLDADAKAKYDAELRKSLKASEPTPSAPAKKTDIEPVSAPAVAPSLPPLYQQAIQPVYPHPAPAAYYPAAPPPVTYAGYGPMQPAAPAPVPLRPIPVPVKEVEPAAEGPEPDFSAAPSFKSLSAHSGRSKNSSSDLTKLAVAGGVAAVLLLAAWMVLSKAEVSASLFGNKAAPAMAKHVTKPKPAPKPSPSTPLPVGTPLKPEVPPEPKLTPSPTVLSSANESPTSNSAPMPAPITPPLVVPETPPPKPPVGLEVQPPKPVTPAPLTPPLVTPTPSVPSSPAQPAKPAERKLWRYTGGFIELTADGSWKELSPTGDYFTLTPLTSLTTSGGPVEVMEFERSAGGRLRVHDNRLEISSALSSSMFIEVAKGSWGRPADELELDPTHQAMLQRACQLYADALAKARRKLLFQFDEAMSVNRKRIGKAEEQLAVVEVLTVEKKRFEDTGLVPWSAPMAADTAKYLVEIHQARGPSEALFDRAMKELVTKKNHEAAASIQALKNKTLAPLMVAKLSLMDVPRTPRLPGFGGFPRRRDDDDPPEDDNSFTDDPRTGIVRLWSNAAVNNANGKSSWNLISANLVLQFVRPAYTVRDTIVIGERGDDVSGKAVFSNTVSLNFTGRFLDTLEPHERRPEVKFAPAE
jgi:hypothetical protein